MLPRFSSIIAGFLFLPALAESAAIVQKVPGIPLAFEQNRGQAPALARYLVRGNRSTNTGLYLTPDSVLVAPFQVGFRFVSANSSAVEIPSELLHGVVNVLRGSTASSWQIGVPRYGRVQYSQIYPGVSVAYTIRDNRVVCHIALDPGADLSGITMEALGASYIYETGSRLILCWGTILHPLDGLTATVTDSSGTVVVPAFFHVIGNRQFQIKLDADRREYRREVQFTVLGTSGKTTLTMRRLVPQAASTWQAGPPPWGWAHLRM
jgi:hypothetical protein